MNIWFAVQPPLIYYTTILDFVKQNRKWIGIAGCALVIIGCFLPFAKASVFGFSTSASLMDGGDGWFLLIAAAVAGVLIYLNKYKYSLVPSAIGVIINIYEISHVTSEGMGIVKVAFAAYLIFIGLALAIASVFVPENK